MTKSLLAVLALSSSLVACVQEDSAPTDLQRAIPTAAQVRIDLPGENARTIGQLADWYVATRNVTRLFNGGSAWVLTLVHTIVQFPVTSVSGNVYTWGPWSEALDPTEYRLDVTDNGDGTYGYQMLGRNKLEAGSTFEVVIDGDSDPRAGELQGNGRFLLDFDASKRVNPIDTDPSSRGQMEASYDLLERHLDLVLDTTDEDGEPATATYAYNETADGGGDMVLELRGDTGGTAAQESIVLRSRWLSSGAGRADGRVQEGDLQGTATASECWNPQFRRTFFEAAVEIPADAVNFGGSEGSVSDCAFATADLP